MSETPRENLGGLFDAVKAIPDETLLTKFAELTHQLHANANPRAGDRIRFDRNLVEAEILRRMSS